MPRFSADMGYGRFASAVLPVVFATAASIVAMSFPARAQASSDTLDLPAAYTRAEVLPAPATGVHRLEGEALRRFATLEEALASLPGFSVRRQGGLGGYSELRFRGAPPAQVDVYVDGIRLNQDGAAAPDLARWPLQWFSSLEARTGHDPRGGPGTLARVDLTTRPEAPGAGGTLRARAGSFGTTEAVLEARGPSIEGHWAWNASVQGQSARNDYPYFSDNKTAFNPDDDATLGMKNNAYWSRGARASARRTAHGAGRGEASETFSLLWLESRKEYPGIFPADARAYGTRSEWMAAWRADRGGGAEAAPWRWGAGAQLRRAEDAYRDPGQSLGYLSIASARAALSGEVEADARRDFATDDDHLGLRDAPRGTLRGDVRLRAEGSGPEETPYTAPYSAPEARRYEAQSGLGADARAGHFAAALDARAVVVQFRAEDLAPTGDTISGKTARTRRAPIAVRAALEGRFGAPGAGEFTAGVVARLEQRAPSSGELLGDNLGIKPMLDLRPEETRALSLLWSLRGAAGGVRGTLSGTTFWNAYRDPIRLMAHGASAFMRHENAAEYRAAGTEVSGFAEARYAEVSGAVTLQELSIREGLYAGNRPAHQSEAEAHAEATVKPLPAARAGLIVDWRGPTYIGDANLPGQRRAAQWELGAHASVTHGPARVALDARNLLDRQYNDFLYSPRSGRSLSLTVSVTL